MDKGDRSMTEQDIIDALVVTRDNFGKLELQSGEIAAAAKKITELMQAGGKAIFCGNGGSAADAQHLAAELMGRFMIDRAPLAAMALNVNVSTITAIGNDYGYDEIFERQLRGIGRTGDVIVGLSTSGNSKNVVAALKAAREMGIYTIGLTGATGGTMKGLCDMCICVPSTSTPRIQEMHIAVGHALCEWVEAALS
jgi:D-sedoheptulose 7-phosphate isomerase